MSLEFLEFVRSLLSLFQFLEFVVLLGVFTGYYEVWTNNWNTWKDVFNLLISFTIAILILQIILIAIRCLGVEENPLVNTAFSWGFRVVALASFLRVLWPAKHWWSNAATAPRYPRLKLFIYSLLALGLSFIPSLLDFR